MRAAEAQPEPPRFVQASSNAVYGSRNPHRVTDVVRADTPTRPFELYSDTKFEAEEFVRASSLEWVVLRLGGVLSPNFSALPLTADGIFIESALPTDGRIHTVDVRDVAAAFAAATTADVARRDPADRRRRLAQAAAEGRRAALAAALGLPGVLPEGRPGDPDDDDGWFLTDWMDTARAQEALAIPASFVAGHARRDAARRWDGSAIRCDSSHLWRGSFSPAAPPTAMRRARYADLWGAIAARLGDPCLTPQRSRSASRGPAGSRRSAGCGTSRSRPAFRRRRGWSAR